MFIDLKKPKILTLPDASWLRRFYEDRDARIHSAEEINQPKTCEWDLTLNIKVVLNSSGERSLFENQA